jgi:hypothetical protein
LPCGSRKRVNVGERVTETRRFRLSDFLHKYHKIHVIHLRNRSNLTDSFIFARFTPHSTDRGTDQNMRDRFRCCHHLIDIRYQGSSGDCFGRPFLSLNHSVPHCLIRETSGIMAINLDSTGKQDLNNQKLEIPDHAL